MELQIPILLGAIAIVAISFWSRRLGAPSSLLLVLVGVLVSFLPWVGEVKVEPELILAGILPPLLYSGAVNIPTMGFRRDFRPIAGLSILLVVLTAICVGFLFSWIVPEIDLATGIALAAIISPTDAVATSLVRRLGAPERLVTVLEGESLLNDASALVILRSAVAAIAGSVSFGWVALEFVWAVVAAMFIGLAVGQISLRLRAKLNDPVLNTAISFVIPFIAFLPAEHVGASGLVSAVMAGLIFGQFAPSYLTPQDRRTEEANWRTVEFLLEGSIFLLMGLELSGLVSDVRHEHGSLFSAVWLGGVGLLAVLAVRAIYLSGLILGQREERRRQPEERQQLLDSRDLLATGTSESVMAAKEMGLSRARAKKHKVAKAIGAKKHGRREFGDEFVTQQSERMRRYFDLQQADRMRRYFDMRIADLDYLIAEPIGKREGALLIWAGMRGAVTLAAAQSLPRDTPQRPLLVLIAFVVAASSLLIQGGTLPWLTRRLGLTGRVDLEASRGERRGLVRRMTDVVGEICQDPDLCRPDGSPYAPAARARVCGDSPESVAVLADPAVMYVQVPELRIRILHAQRTTLLELRDEGLYSSATLNDALAIIDSDEIALAIRGSAFDGGVD